MKKIERLEELRKEILLSGPIVKRTYKELCEWVGWEPSSNRKALLESLGKWMNIQKINGTRSGYIISEVYPERIKKEKKRKKSGSDLIQITSDVKYKRPVGRPRTKSCKLTIVEMEKRQGYSLYFRSNNIYLEPAFHILVHDILNSDNQEIKYSRKGLSYRLGMLNYNLESDPRCTEYTSSDSELFSFWYYAKMVSENIIDLNILQGLCDRKHIFIYQDTYYNADTHLPENINPFASEKENKVIESIIQDNLALFELTEYNELFFPTKESFYAARKALKKINAEIQETIGWSFWGKGYTFSINPKIPWESINYLKDHDITKDKKAINEAWIKRLKSTLSSRNQKYSGYIIDQNEEIIGKKSETDKNKYISLQETSMYIIDNYLKI